MGQRPALLTLDLERQLLQVAQMWRDDVQMWALPGAFARRGETLADAVQRCLRYKLGVAGIRPHQLHVFDDPDRDDLDWVISVAHVAVVRPEHLDSLGSGSASEIASRRWTGPARCTCRASSSSMSVSLRNVSDLRRGGREA